MLHGGTASMKSSATPTCYFLLNVAKDQAPQVGYASMVCNLLFSFECCLIGDPFPGSIRGVYGLLFSFECCLSVMKKDIDYDLETCYFLLNVA